VSLHHLKEITMKTEARDECSLFTAEHIYEYSRAQAIADGVLIDATEMARNAGFVIPVALTSAVWEECVAWDRYDNVCQVYQDESGRLWDVLWMAYMAIRARRETDDSNRLPYHLYVVPRDGRSQEARKIELHVHIGPGDAGEPVLTIMLPWED